MCLTIHGSMVNVKLCKALTDFSTRWSHTEVYFTSWWVVWATIHHTQCELLVVEWSTLPVKSTKMVFRHWIIDHARIPPLRAYSNLNNNQTPIYLSTPKQNIHMCHLKPSIIDECRQHAEQLKNKICKFTDSWSDEVNNHLQLMSKVTLSQRLCWEVVQASVSLGTYTAWIHTLDASFSRIL